MSRPARILLLNERDPLHPKAGGAEVHVAEIGRRLVGRGHAITQLAVSFPGAPASEQVAGMAVRRLGGMLRYYATIAPTVARETRRGRFDVVVEHLNKVPFCAAAYAAVPVIAVNHHLFGRSAFLQVSWPIALGVVAIEQLVPHVYRRARLLAVSPSSRDDLVRRGLRDQEIGLVYNGITPPTLPPTPMAHRPLRVAYLGRLEPYKRVDQLLRAVSSLVHRFAHLELLVVGRGSEQPRLAALAHELGIGARCHFAGFVPDTERDRLLASARVCVCPSVKEGWGITVVEANALGVPVVATDAPGLRDAVRHGETGLLVPDAEPRNFARGLAGAIETLLSNDELAARLAEQARAWSRSFTWDSAADAMEAAVADALGTRP